MPPVLIACPATLDLVLTGLHAESLEELSDTEGHSLPACPACGGDHSWTRKRCRRSRYHGTGDLGRKPSALPGRSLARALHGDRRIRCMSRRGSQPDREGENNHGS
jgi:hypothetical protein